MRFGPYPVAYNEVSNVRGMGVVRQKGCGKGLKGIIKKGLMTLALDSNPSAYSYLHQINLDLQLWVREELIKTIIAFAEAAFSCGLIRTKTDKHHGPLNIPGIELWERTYV